MNNLSTVLGENALFSGISGIALIVLHQSFASWFGVHDSSPFWIVGIALVLFALHVWYESRKVPKRLFPIMTIFVMDVLWVFGSVVVVAAQLWQLTDIGYVAIGISACVVGMFAWLEARGLQGMLCYTTHNG